MHKVFVYGTLKSGFHNHYLLDKYKFEEAEAEGFNLHASAYLPYAVPGKGTVKGELYEVDIFKLHQLDHLEGHPHFYRRIEAKVKTAAGLFDAWIYIYPKGIQFPLIESGEWPG